MYYSGIAMVGEGANVVVTINDLLQGNITSLVNLLPLAGQAMAATSKGSAALFQMQMYGGAIMENLDTAACKLLGGGGCFTAGTIVQTENGPEPIEQVQAGDLVWAFNMQSDSWELDPVQTAFSKPYDGTIVTATINGQAISMTADHPVYVLSGIDLSSRPVSVGADDQPQTEPGRWVDASDLQIGDVLQAETGGSVVVSALSLAYESTQVYSLTVDNAHTFAVGADGVLVHNGCTQAQFNEIRDNWREWFDVVEEQQNGQTVFRIGNRRLINAKKAFGSGGSITVQLLDELDAAGNPTEVTVPFTKEGFPDFSNFLYDTSKGGENRITLKSYTGSRAKDFDLANEQANFAKTPEGYTWHHTENLGEMILVRSDVHAAVKHTGGVAIYKAGIRRIYASAGRRIPEVYVD